MIVLLYELHGFGYENTLNHELWFLYFLKENIMILQYNEHDDETNNDYDLWTLELIFIT